MVSIKIDDGASVFSTSKKFASRFFRIGKFYLNIVSGAPLIRSQYDTLLNAVCMFLFYCVFRVSFDSWIAQSIFKCVYLSILWGRNNRKYIQIKRCLNKAHLRLKGGYE